MPSRRNVLKASLATAALHPVIASAAAQTGPARSAGDGGLPHGLTLLSIRQSDGGETLGIKTKNGVIDVVQAARLLNVEAPSTLEELLEKGTGQQLQKIMTAVPDSPAAKSALLSEASIKFGKLFTNPSKIICVGLNYKEHVDESGEKLPTIPILFNKYNNTLASHNCTITLPPREISYKFDYETELLIVMGKTTRNVSESDALSYVAGYAVGHDFSARDLQLETGGQWMVGKTLDDFAPIGPYFVSADQIDPNHLSIETRVNGELRQSSNTDKFIFNPQKVISYASKLFTLVPGDIIFTGTPSGVIVGMPKDKQIWLKAGDRIESTIQNLGTLKFDLA